MCASSSGCINPQQPPAKTGGVAPFPLNWLRVLRSTEAARIGPRVGQQHHTRAVRPEKYMRLRGRAWDGNARDCCVFWLMRSLSTDPACLSFLPLFQEVRSIHKTRNQFIACWSTSLIGTKRIVGRVAAYTSRLRQAQGLAPRRQGRRQTLPVVAEPTTPTLTPRRVTWVVLRRPEQRTADEAQQLAQVRAQSAAVAEAIDLAEDLTTLIRQRQPAQLDPWLKRAATSTLAALRRFAQGLYADYQAVKSGVTLPWSTGPVEGHINRLKMLKRKMFGRAHLDLLGQRFLRTPRARETQGVGPRTPVQTQATAPDA